VADGIRDKRMSTVSTLDAIYYLSVEIVDTPPVMIPEPDIGQESRFLPMNASVTSQTAEEGFAIRICQRRLSIFGHVRRLQEATPAHSTLRLAVDTCRR